MWPSLEKVQDWMTRLWLDCVYVFRHDRTTFVKCVFLAVTFGIFGAVVFKVERSRGGAGMAFYLVGGLCGQYMFLGADETRPHSSRAWVRRLFRSAASSATAFVEAGLIWTDHSSLDLEKKAREVDSVFDLGMWPAIGICLRDIVIAGMVSIALFVIVLTALRCFDTPVRSAAVSPPRPDRFRSGRSTPTPSTSTSPTHPPACAPVALEHVRTSEAPHDEAQDSADTSVEPVDSARGSSRINHLGDGHTPHWMQAGAAIVDGGARSVELLYKEEAEKKLGAPPLSAVLGQPEQGKNHAPDQARTE